MVKSYAVYAESFVSRVAGIAKRSARLAGDTFAPSLMNLGDRYIKNVKTVWGDKETRVKTGPTTKELPLEFLRNKNLNQKYQLDKRPEIGILGLVDPNNESKGYKITFKGNVRLKNGSITTTPGDHYIIVTMNGDKAQTNGKLYSLSQRNRLIEKQQLISSQKNIIFETEKLVDLFLK